MKAISLWEPWSTAMAMGLKKLETRAWPTGYRGPLVICSAKRKMDNVGLAIWGKHIQPYVAGQYVPDYGHALCMVELFECLPVDSIAVKEPERLLGDYSPGRWAWLTRNVQRLRQPVPVTGHQGLFSLTPEEQAAIKKAL